MAVVATIYTPLPTPNAWVLIGTVAATTGSPMVQADGAMIEFAVVAVGSPPAAGSRGMSLYPNTPPFPLFGGAVGGASYAVYAMSPQGAGAGAFFTSTA